MVNVDLLVEQRIVAIKNIYCSYIVKLSTTFWIVHLFLPCSRTPFSNPGRRSHSWSSSRYQAKTALRSGSCCWRSTRNRNTTPGWQVDPFQNKMDQASCKTLHDAFSLLEQHEYNGDCWWLTMIDDGWWLQNCLKWQRHKLPSFVRCSSRSPIRITSPHCLTTSSIPCWAAAAIVCCKVSFSIKGTSW